MAEFSVGQGVPAYAMCKGQVMLLECARRSHVAGFGEACVREVGEAWLSLYVSILK